VSRLDIAPEHLAIVQAVLKKNVPRRVVWAFGSRVKGTAKPYSDLDLAVVGDTPLSWVELAGLVDDFSNSDLPWKVDIVDWANTSEEFRKVILARKIEIQRPSESKK
jgi:putative type I restriction modification system, specificity protein